MKGMMIIFHPIFGFHFDHRGSVRTVALRTAGFLHTVDFHYIVVVPRTDCIPVHTAGEAVLVVLVRNKLAYWPETYSDPSVQPGRCLPIAKDSTQGYPRSS